MRRKKTWLALIAVPPLLLAVFVVGIFVYVNATVVPLHPDPQKVPAAAQSTPSERWKGAVEQARQLARTSVTEQNLPGLSIAVGAGGDVVWAEGFGWADIEKKMAVAPNVRFRIGTASVALTSAAIGLLLDQERMHLDAEIQTYVSAFPEKQWPITLRHLMGHTAGVRRDAGDEEPVTEHCERTIDGLKRFADASLLSEPGTEFRFSTYGWMLASAAVEAAAGEPFFPFMRTRVFERLGMRDTTAEATTDPIPDLATYYFPRFGADPRYGPQDPEPVDYSCFTGSSAFVSTPSDLVRFAMGINGGKLLKPATAQMLQTPQRLSSGEETGYGLGWHIETVTLAGKETRSIGHDGALRGGMVSSFMTFPEHGFTVAVAANTSFADTKSIAVKMAHAFVEHAKGR
jgi:CubicO group peptidase (beta-lactamase class C family)